MKIGITGVTRTGNLGGVMMLETTLMQMRKRHQDCEFYLFSISPKQDLSLAAIEDLTIVPVNYKCLILFYLPMSLLLWPLSRLPLLRNVFHLFPFYRKVRQCDLIADLAGVAFVDGRGLALLAYNMAICLPALVVKVPLIKLSQALGPFNQRLNRLAAKFVLSRCEHVVARGKISLEHLNSLSLNNIYHYPDTTFSFKVNDSAQLQAQTLLKPYNLSQPPVIICPSEVVRRLCDQQKIDYVKILVKFISTIADSMPVIILAHSVARDGSKNNDVGLCDTIYKQTKIHQQVFCLENIQDPMVIRAIFDHAKLFIGSRFHSVVNALAMATPSLIIGWSHKYQEMAADLEADKFALPYQQLSLDSLKNLFQSMVNDVDNITLKLKQHLPRVRKDAEKSYDLLMKTYYSTTAQPHVKTDALKKIVDNRHCMGCGMCTVSKNAGAPKINMQYNKQQDCYTPFIAERGANVLPEIVCPGENMNMPALSRAMYGQQPQNAMLGNYVNIHAAYAMDPGLRQQAASGGVIPVVLHYLFAHDLIDVAYCAIPGKSSIHSKGHLVFSSDELKGINGSIYHPVDFGQALQQLFDGQYRFAFVGLPCEIAGLSMLKQQHPEFAKRHVISIGLFCGGINTFKGIDYYLSFFGMTLNNVKTINYRHGKWPGKIKLSTEQENKAMIIPRIRGNTRWKILRYVIAFQGYWMLKRCRLCPDQIADFADIAVGDPHLPRFRQLNSDGYSALITRSEFGDKLIKNCIDEKKLCVEPLSAEELMNSQSYTLDNRRHVMAYVRVAKLFGMSTPNITVYEGLDTSLKPRHYVYAFVDLMKVALPKGPIIKCFYLPWQIFEYLFLTFAPQLIIKKLVKLIRNR